LKKLRRALVTGGCGFIGSHIVDELLKRGIETNVLDDLSTGNLYNIKKHKNNKLFHFTVGDISKIKELFENEERFDVVFHEAAIASVTQSVDNPARVFETNVNSAFKVLNFCKDNAVKKIIFASSSAVYGNFEGQELSENIYCNPTSPYGASKLAIEYFLQTYWKTYGLETVSLRYFNVYGPRQISNEYSGVITIFINQLLKNQPLMIYGNGKQTRDFINIKDIVRANMLAMECPRAAGEIFNIGTGTQTTILELAELTQRVTNRQTGRIIFLRERPGDIKKSVSNVSKSEKILGFNPSVSLFSGLSDYLNSQESVSLLL
jgi:UDP-glucose 4-epimerase